MKYCDWLCGLIYSYIIKNWMREIKYLKSYIENIDVILKNVITIYLSS